MFLGIKLCTITIHLRTVHAYFCVPRMSDYIRPFMFDIRRNLGTPSTHVVTIFVSCNTTISLVCPIQPYCGCNDVAITFTILRSAG